MWKDPGNETNLMSRDNKPYRVGTSVRGKPIYDFIGVEILTDDQTAKAVEEAKRKPSHHQATEAWNTLDLLNLGRGENDINQHPDGDGCLDTGCN